MIWNLQSLSHQPNKILRHPSHPAEFFATQILGGNVTSCNQGLSSWTKGGREERPWERGWNPTCWPLPPEGTQNNMNVRAWYAKPRAVSSSGDALLAARGFSTRRSYVTLAVTFIFLTDFWAKWETARSLILGLHCHAIKKNNSKIIQYTKSRNYNVIGDK